MSRNSNIKAKVVRVGRYWQVLTKREDGTIRRLGRLGGFMEWEREYNSFEDVEGALERVWGFTVVKSFK